MKLGRCLVLTLVCATPVLADSSVGVASLDAGDRSRPVSLTFWYPAEGGTPENVGGNAVFLGTPAGRDAPMRTGRFPLALVSHGGLRSAPDSGAWLGAALAQAGFVAVEVNGPPPRTGQEAVNEIWRRPQDVSRALDAVLVDPAWSVHVEPTRISVVGFALGGTAALALAGGGFEAQSYGQSCDAGATGPDCAWFAAQDVALDAVEPAQLAALRRDPRIGAAVAIEPEYLDVFGSGLPELAVPTLRLVLAGEGGAQEASESVGLAQAVVPDASAFDAFPVCTPAGAAILAEEGGDPALCGASAQARRAAQAAISGRVVSFLTGARSEAGR